jgi:lipopolysaccharide/colanic/teichoic acid biosynthesis glycosyltransferase
LPDRRKDAERYFYATAIVTDMVIIAAALVLAVTVRFGSVRSYPLPALVRTWAFFAAGAFVSSVVEHLYRLRTTVNGTMHVFRMVRIILTTSIIYVILFFLLHFPSRLLLDSRLAVSLFILFWGVLWIPARTLLQPWIFAALFGRPEGKRLRVMLIGPGETCAEIGRMLCRSWTYCRMIEVFCIDAEIPDDPKEIFRLTMENMERTGADQHAVIFSDHGFPVIAEYCQFCYRAGMRFAIYSPRVLDLRYFDPWLSLRDHGAVTFFGGGQGRGYRLVIRLGDILVSSAALLVFAPLFLLVALLVKLGSRGPVFFSQTRIGYGMKPFRFFKFRSMRRAEASADEAHREYFRRYANGSAASDDGTVYKLEQPDRTTAIGRFIRKTSIDELPQFFNVLLGNMTLVGPRPCIDYELEHYNSWQLERFDVKPGLTGIWQVYGRSRLPFDTAQFLDFLYTIDRSPALNLRLILKTIPVMLFGRGGV